MSGMRRVLAATVFITAAAFAVQGPAFAGGASGNAGPADSGLGALAGSEMSSTQLNAVRGQGGVKIDPTQFNTVLCGGNCTANDSFNQNVQGSVVSASADGSISGNTINGGSTTGPAGGNWVISSSGFINQVANSGNAVMINQATSIAITTTP